MDVTDKPAKVYKELKVDKVIVMFVDFACASAALVWVF